MSIRLTNETADTAYYLTVTRDLLAKVAGSKLGKKAAKELDSAIKCVAKAQEINDCVHHQLSGKVEQALDSMRKLQSKENSSDLFDSIDS